MNLAKNIKKLRKKNGLSQAELAKKVDCHVNHINRIETKKYIPSLEIVAKIAEVFKISIDELVYDDSDSIKEITLKDESFNRKMQLLNSLDEEDKEVITKVIDAIITKKQMMNLLQANKN